MAHLNPKDSVRPSHSQPKTKNKKKGTAALDTRMDATDKENEGFEAINTKKPHVIIACVVFLHILYYSLCLQVVEADCSHRRTSYPDRRKHEMEGCLWVRQGICVGWEDCYRVLCSDRQGTLR